jgi:ribose-phosphate pyrophosphokinase
MESKRLPPLLFTLGSNPNLARQTSILTGLSLSETKIGHYADGECYAKVRCDVTGRDCYIIHSTCNPVNENVMTLLLFVDALKQSGAKTITIIMPYFGYARQDRVVNPGDSVGGLLVGTMLATAGANRVISCDFHSLKLLAKFPLEHDNLTAENLFAKRFIQLLEERKLANSDVVAVSTDHGGLERVAQFALNFPGCTTGYADKVRPAANIATVQAIHGNVKGKVAIIFDDMIDTAGTLHEVAKALYKEGAKDVWVAATHGIFSKNAQDLIIEAGIKTLLVSDSIEQPLKVGEVVSIAPLLADFILNDAELID